MLKIELKFDTSKLDMKVVYTKVCTDVIQEIKNLISRGKNINNETLHKKRDGKTPDFDDTGRLLSQIAFKVDDNGFEIFINDTERKMIGYYLQQRWNWKILDGSKYMDTFIQQKIDIYLQEILNTI